MYNYVKNFIRFRCLPSVPSAMVITLSMVKRKILILMLIMKFLEIVTRIRKHAYSASFPC